MEKFFVALKSYGIANEKGKTAMAIEYSGKRIFAEPDAPLGLFVAMLETMSPMFQYTSVEAAERDAKRLKKWVDGLVVTSPEKRAKRTKP
jgi:hypothetical protein